eukprot:2420812-Pyramimonas_sp.AAC.1
MCWGPLIGSSAPVASRRLGSATVLGRGTTIRSRWARERIAELLGWLNHPLSPCKAPLKQREYSTSEPAHLTISAYRFFLLSSTLLEKSTRAASSTFARKRFPCGRRPSPFQGSTQTCAVR